MGRQQNNSSNNRGQSAQNLLGFHFSTPAPSQQPERNRNRNFQNYNNRRKQNNAYKPSAQDRTSCRRKANTAMFYLHSSSEHQFCLTRQAHSKLSKGKYSFEGSDSPVSWESVRIVKQMLALSSNKVDEEPSCPICLCEFVSARITKCGHCFCLSCLLHHVHANSAAQSNHQVRCPCCAIPIHLEDLKPVMLENVVAPEVQQSITLVKLHREKTCSAPYIPIPGYSKHSHPSCVPCIGDADEKFSRFNYVDSSVYLSLLYQNRTEVEEEAKSLPQNCLDQVFVQMALEMVLKDIQTAEIEAPTEVTFQQDMVKPTSGFYQQLLPDPLLASTHRCSSIGNEKEASENVEMQLAGGKPKRNKLERYAGSLYMDEASTLEYYQAEDGQLVFLCGFNMNCLLADFRRGRPEVSGEELRFPLPDRIKGRVLEIDRKNMTPELQKRLPFLSHLPLYVDFMFVELDLNHILTEQAKQKFKNEFANRRKRRQSKVKAEKKADKAKEREEMQRINERRSRFQTIDPGDDFFQPYVPEEFNLGAADFDATLGGDGSRDILGASPPLSASPRIQAPLQNQELNFMAAARDNGLVVSSTEAFPTLCSVTSIPSSGSNPAPPSWGGAKPLQRQGFPALSSPVKKTPGGKKKGKGGGKGQLLFSTGGQRGTGYR
ncbi:unnamed protein product [Cylindrotheca closterium]|uniref:RING-type domain-containing protein n=1 Tax=Cylindrotheca closterium TaxID=2856 RepID=A0AAD2FIH2_9STRA|nr:unnamed protein product [Cylindrotheca closterium]